MHLTRRGRLLIGVIILAAALVVPATLAVGFNGADLALLILVVAAVAVACTLD